MVLIFAVSLIHGSYIRWAQCVTHRNHILIASQTESHSVNSLVGCEMFKYINMEIGEVCLSNPTKMKFQVHYGVHSDILKI
jgi:hypothetical protein